MENFFLLFLRSFQTQKSLKLTTTGCYVSGRSFPIICKVKAAKTAVSHLGPSKRLLWRVADSYFHYTRANNLVAVSFSSIAVCTAAQMFTELSECAVHSAQLSHSKLRVSINFVESISHRVILNSLRKKGFRVIVFILFSKS